MSGTTATPIITADIVLFRPVQNDLQILLIQRARSAYAGCWALPGGKLNTDESIEQCAERELYEETGIRGVALEQVKVFSAPGRDPRGHYISVVFYGLVDAGTAALAGDDAALAKWFSISALPADLAFDHANVIRAAIRAAFLRGNIHAQSQLYAISLKAEKLFPTDRGLAQAVAHVSAATIAPDLETAQRIAVTMSYERFSETKGWTGQDGHASEIPADLLQQALKARPARN